MFWRWVGGVVLVLTLVGSASAYQCLGVYTSPDASLAACVALGFGDCGTWYDPYADPPCGSCTVRKGYIGGVKKAVAHCAACPGGMSPTGVGGLCVAGCVAPLEGTPPDCHAACEAPETWNGTACSCALGEELVVASGGFRACMSVCVSPKSRAITEPFACECPGGSVDLPGGGCSPVCPYVFQDPLSNCADRLCPDGKKLDYLQSGQCLCPGPEEAYRYQSGYYLVPSDICVGGCSYTAQGSYQGSTGFRGNGATCAPDDPGTPLPPPEDDPVCKSWEFLNKSQPLHYCEALPCPEQQYRDYGGVCHWIPCAGNQHRNESGSCVANDPAHPCPFGEHWDGVACVSDLTPCPSGWKGTPPNCTIDGGSGTPGTPGEGGSGGAGGSGGSGGQAGGPGQGGAGGAGGSGGAGGAGGVGGKGGEGGKGGAGLEMGPNTGPPTHGPFPTVPVDTDWLDDAPSWQELTARAAAIGPNSPIGQALGGFDFDIEGSGTCPSFTISVPWMAGASVTVDVHCRIWETISGLISALSMAGYSYIAVRRFIR